MNSNKVKLLIFSIVFIFGSKAWASQGFSNEITYSLGMTSVSYTETESALEGENKKTPASGGVTALSGNIHYKFKSLENRSYYVSGSFPFFSGAEGSYFNLAGGVEFYLNSLGSRLALENQGTTIKFTPKLTYFWGVEVGISYLVYLTETAKKSDLLFDLGLIGGGHYTINEKWTLKAQLAAFKGTGVNTGTFGFKFFLGGTFYL